MSSRHGTRAARRRAKSWNERATRCIERTAERLDLTGKSPVQQLYLVASAVEAEYGEDSLMARLVRARFRTLLAQLQQPVELDTIQGESPTATFALSDYWRGMIDSLQRMTERLRGA
jgi:hypothetical protein